MADTATSLETSAPANPPATTAQAPPEPWHPKFNPWLIGVIVAGAAFMEVLDTSIANVALPYIGGNLGASTDQSTWILTSYLVSNAVVLPISGWLSGHSDVSAFSCCVSPSSRSAPFFAALLLASARS